MHVFDQVLIFDQVHVFSQVLVFSRVFNQVRVHFVPRKEQDIEGLVGLWDEKTGLMGLWDESKPVVSFLSDLPC